MGFFFLFLLIEISKLLDSIAVLCKKILQNPFKPKFKISVKETAKLLDNKNFD